MGLDRNAAVKACARSVFQQDRLRVRAWVGGCAYPQGLKRASAPPGLRAGLSLGGPPSDAAAELRLWHWRPLHTGVPPTPLQEKWEGAFCRGPQTSRRWTLAALGVTGQLASSRSSGLSIPLLPPLQMSPEPERPESSSQDPLNGEFP